PSLCSMTAAQHAPRGIARILFLLQKSVQYAPHQPLSNRLYLACLPFSIHLPCIAIPVSTREKRIPVEVGKLHDSDGQVLVAAR
ncbi:MAG: hypothetical protein WA626_01050, partial [Acidobacteriaceae bacterium]